MILFLGDSFTWGQGLYYEKWYNELGISVNRINRTLPPNMNHENISYIDDLYRREHHYPNLVSKHFNKRYVTRYGNGGSNRNIINILENVNHQTIFEGIELVIIQFTYWMRDIENPNLIQEYKKKYLINEVEALDMIMKHQIEKVVSLLRSPQGYQVFKNGTNNWSHYDFFDKGNGLKFLFICQEPEWAEYINKNYSEHLIKINYNNNEFNSLTEFVEYNNKLLNNKQKILLSDEIGGCSDMHFSKQGHRLISSSVIRKIEELSLL